VSTATPPRDPQPQNSTRRRPDITRPDTITDAAQIAHDLVMRRTNGDTELADIIRRGIHDAYRTGANRALETAAQELDMHAQYSAAHRVRTRKINPEKEN